MADVIPLPDAAVRGEVIAADVGQLAAEYPDWEVGSQWVGRPTGPDARFLWARCGKVIVTGWDRYQIAEQIRSAERSALPGGTS
jgi:hypothetical protein